MPCAARQCAGELDAFGRDPPARLHWACRRRPKGRALRRFPPRPKIPCRFPFPRNAKSRTPRATFLLVTLGSPAVLDPRIRDLRIRDFPSLPHDRFGFSFVGGKHYTEVMERQRSVLVRLSAVEDVPLGVPTSRRRDGGREKSLVTTRTSERLHGGPQAVWWPHRPLGAASGRIAAGRRSDERSFKTDG